MFAGLDGGDWNLNPASLADCDGELATLLNEPVERVGDLERAAEDAEEWWPVFK